MAAGLLGKARALWNSPVGPRTTHFWGPVANWGFVVAGLADTAKPPEQVSPKMTAALCVYSALFMRFAWAIQPRNYLLLACHVANEGVQLNQGRRYLTAQSHAQAQAAGDQSPADKRTRVVVLGSGWGAVTFLRHLPRALLQASGGRYELTLVSPRNYFLYTPLLPGAATGTVEPRSIVMPIRRLARGKDIATYYEAEATHIDTQAKTVRCRFSQRFREADPNVTRDFDIPYDVLVVAVGSVTNTFNVPGVKEHCLFLKDMEHARQLRQRVNASFELASLPGTTDEERRKLLSFVVVGGGPTGVEVAAELHDLVTEDMRDLFPELAPFVEIKLVDTHDSILSMYDRQLAIYATETFKRSGIGLVLNCRVNAVQPDAVVVTQRGQQEPTNVMFGTCVWATGIRLNPLCSSLMEQLQGADHWKSLPTDTHLRVKATAGSIYALGDAATVQQESALEHAAELFEQGDVNHDGCLSCQEVHDLMHQASKRYPQLKEFAARISCNGEDAQGDAVSRFFHSILRSSWFGSSKPQGLPTEKPHNLAGKSLTLEEFKAQLQEIDKSVRSLPATAQVASQQGEYLAKLFSSQHINGTAAANAAIDTAPPFKYRHLGNLAYIGADKAVMDTPYKDTPVSSFKGWLMGFAWKGGEVFMQISVRNMFLVSRDLISAKIFGRDVSDVA